MIISSLVLLAVVTPYAQADSLYAYEYSTNYPHEIRRNDNDDDVFRSNNDVYRSNKRQAPVYQQQPQIMIYPNITRRDNQERYLRQRMEDEHEEHEWREQERDEQYWRRRRWELERQPHSRYEENQFYRDDTHW
ncbi:MAG: hypothetical protein RL755_800 [Pseudomonadota bacterium]